MDIEPTAPNADIVQRIHEQSGLSSAVQQGNQALQEAGPTPMEQRTDSYTPTPNSRSGMPGRDALPELDDR
tara:strand:- start:10374 stop:10586 length:213 start_codon:yes stop_codon:yes gene_type:complete